MSYTTNDTEIDLGSLEIMNQLLMAEVHSAMMANNWSQVEHILFQNPSIAKEVDPFSGQNILHKLCKEENTPMFTLEMVVLLNAMALAHRDNMGYLPIHYACQYGSLDVVSLIMEAYKISAVERNRGRLPIHIAAEYNTLPVVKYLVAMDQSTLSDRVQKHTGPKEGLKMASAVIPKIGKNASTIASGGLPLHYACRNYRNPEIVIYLAKQNPYAAAISDDSGEFPLHILVRQGTQIDIRALKALLEASAAVTSIRDKIGNFPLATALIRRCSETVIQLLLDTFPLAASERDRNSKLPIEVATDQSRSFALVRKLLLCDMPIDMEENTYLTSRAHGGSWHYILSYQDLYFPVVETVLKQCSYTQVRALSEAKDRYGNVAKDIATPVCLHELNLAMRMCGGTLQVVDYNPAFKNPISETEIYFGLKFDSNRFDPVFLDIDSELKNPCDEFQLEHVPSRSVMKARVNKKLADIHSEIRYKVIIKATTRRDVFERDTMIRQEFDLSPHYVAAIFSAYPSLHLHIGPTVHKGMRCLIMECADTTLENMLPNLNNAGLEELVELLYSVATPLYYLHRQSLIHGDYGAHNIGRFGDQFKLLGVGGCITLGNYTDICRGFYLPPEAVQVDKKSFIQSMISTRPRNSRVLSLQAYPSFDIWAFGCIMFELLTGKALSLYSKNGFKQQRLDKIAKFTTKKLLKEINDSRKSIHPQLIQLLLLILDPNPNLRVQSMEGILFRLEGIVGGNVRIGIMQRHVLPLQSLSFDISENISPVTSEESEENEEDDRSWTDMEESELTIPLQEARSNKHLKNN